MGDHWTAQELLDLHRAPRRAGAGRRYGEALAVAVAAEIGAAIRLSRS